MGREHDGLSDAGWERLRLFLPVSSGRCGRWRDCRQVIDGILYRVRTGVQRRDLLVRPDVLILDDFAMRQLGASQADDLYELVSERQGRSLIITSNRAPSDWYPLFPNPVVAESLLDRLINTSHQVIMNGPSYRPNKRPKNPTDKTK